MSRMKKKRSFGPSSSQVEAARAAQENFGGFSPRSGEEGLPREFEGIEGIEAYDSASGTPSPRAQSSSDNGGPATPAIDGYQRFLAEHAERKREVALPPETGELSPHHPEEPQNDAGWAQFDSRGSCMDRPSVPERKLIQRGVEVDAQAYADNAEVKLVQAEAKKVASETHLEVSSKPDMHTHTPIMPDADFDNLRDELDKLRAQVSDVLYKGKSSPPTPDIYLESAALKTEQSPAFSMPPWTPHKSAGVNPESIATAQKNPMKIADSEKIRHELKSLQEQILCTVGKCTNIGSGESGSLLDLEKMKQDLALENCELEAAIRTRSFAEPDLERQAVVTPKKSSDPFFVQLDHKLAEVLRERQVKSKTDTSDLTPRSESSVMLRKTATLGDKQVSRTRSLAEDVNDKIAPAILRRTWSEHSATSCGSQESEAFEQDLRVRGLRKDHENLDQAIASKLASLSPAPDSSVQEQLLIDLGQKNELQRKIEFFFRQAPDSDTEFTHEAQKKLAQIKHEIEESKAQLAVFFDSNDLAQLPSSTNSTLQRQSKVLAADGIESDSCTANRDSLLDIQPEAAKSLIDAYDHLQVSVTRFFFAGRLYIFFAVLVLLSGVVAPFTLPAVPGLFFLLLGIYQIRYASSLPKQSELKREDMVEQDEERDGRVDDVKMPDAPFLIWPASCVLILALLIACLSFGYSFYTLLDLMGTPACAANTRYSPLCQDPLRDDSKRATIPNSSPTGLRYTSLPVKTVQSVTTQEESDDMSVNDSPPPPPNTNSMGSQVTEGQDIPGTRESPPPSQVSSPTTPNSKSASNPMIQPSGGDFLNYVTFTVHSEDGFLALTTDESQPICDQQSVKLNLVLGYLQQSKVVRFRSCSAGASNSEIVVETFNIIPGPVVNVKVNLADTVSAENVDLDTFKKDFKKLEGLEGLELWQMTTPTLSTVSMRRQESLSINIGILADSASLATERATAIEAADPSGLFVGGKPVLRFKAFVFDPALVIQLDVQNASTANEPGVYTPGTNETVTAMDGSDVCLNVLTSSEFADLLRGCNGANICIDDMVKSLGWLPCRGYLMLSAVCGCFMLLLAFFVGIYSKFGLAVLER